MRFRYTLPEKWVKKIVDFGEFADGATQVSIRTKDGRIFDEVLVSNCMYIIAVRNHDDLPFSINDIEDVFQTNEDLNPKKKDGWEFWDDWQIPQGRFKPKEND